MAKLATNSLLKENIVVDKEELSILLEKFNFKFNNIKDFFINCYRYNTTNLNDIFDKFVEYKKLGRGVKLSKMLLQYGDVEGNLRWKSYCDKQAITNTFEYKRQKYGMTPDDFKKYNASRAVTLSNLISRYGLEKGTEKWDSYCNKQKRNGCTLDYFIEKYGDGGQQKYKEVCESKAHTYTNYLKWYGDEGVERFKKHIMFSSLSYASKSSQLFLNKLYHNLNDFDKEKCYFHDKNNEFGLMDKVTKTYKKYDFCLPNKKLIIEYNGDHIHANPKIYGPHDIPKYFRKKERYTAQEIWNADLHKKHIAESYGYTVYYVWDSDDIETKIQELIEVINGLPNN